MTHAKIKTKSVKRWKGLETEERSPNLETTRYRKEGTALFSSLFPRAFFFDRPTCIGQCKLWLSPKASLSESVMEKGHNNKYYVM